ncbi:hypothetical protein ACLEPN_25350 [Myxococcus sp. 1LA]
MKRSVFGLVLALSLTACKEEPRGKMEPIPRPPGMKDAPPPAEAAPAQAAEPPADPSKVVLRWKLAAGAPTSYRLDIERTGGAPAATEEAAPAKGAKGKGKEKPAPAAAPAAPCPPPSPTPWSGPTRATTASASSPWAATPRRTSAP